jgi:signal transduction histidine kinase
VTRLLLTDVRDVVGALREERALDLRRALEDLASAAPEPRVHLACPTDLEVSDPLRAHTLFRCAQEAITNAVRHAQAKNVWIELSREADGGLQLHARDDGRGAAAVEPGNGLRGMRERLEEAGGSLEIAAAPGAGFALRAALPAFAGGRGRP